MTNLVQNMFYYIPYVQFYYKKVPARTEGPKGAKMSSAALDFGLNWSYLSQMTMDLNKNGTRRKLRI